MVLCCLVHLQCVCVCVCSSLLYHDHTVDSVLGYLLLIPPRSDSSAAAATIVILRENVMTLLVTEFFWLGCRMKSPSVVCCMRSMRIDVAVTFTMRPYSWTPLLMNEQTFPMCSLACLEDVMRVQVVDAIIVCIIVFLLVVT